MISTTGPIYNVVMKPITASATWHFTRTLTKDPQKLSYILLASLKSRRDHYEHYFRIIHSYATFSYLNIQ